MRLDLAELCRVKGRFAVAARFYREAFLAKPARWTTTCRLNIVSTPPLPLLVLARLRIYQGQSPLDEAEHARWPLGTRLASPGERCSREHRRRRRSRANRRLSRPLNDGEPKLPLARKTLEILTHHRDLACERERRRAQEIPQGERKEWQTSGPRLPRFSKRRISIRIKRVSEDSPAETAMNPRKLSGKRSNGPKNLSFHDSLRLARRFASSSHGSTAAITSWFTRTFHSP